MAIRHLITGSFITLLLLGGCGSVPDTDAGSADAGSAPQQAVIVDPPLDDAAVHRTAMEQQLRKGLTEDDLRLLRRLLTQIYQNALEATHGPCSTPICDPLPSTPTIEEGEHTHG